MDSIEQKNYQSQYRHLIRRGRTLTKTLFRKLIQDHKVIFTTFLNDCEILFKDSFWLIFKTNQLYELYQELFQEYNTIRYLLLDQCSNYN